MSSRMGDTIRIARVKAGMTEKALAKKCGASESFIKDVETGGKIIGDALAERILKILGVENPVSTELEVAAEPPMPEPPKPRPRAYILPVEEEPKKKEEFTPEVAEATDAWLDALSGLVKRVPIVGPDNIVIDHVLTPVVDGRIEGGKPAKALYYRCPDNALSGWRVYAGDLLLTVPATTPIEGAIMLLQYKGERIVRKINKMDGGRVNLQSYDREYESRVLPLKEVYILGRCVRLTRAL